MSEDITKKYNNYFNIDDAYFPCIDDSAIKAGAKWEITYPHETFIKLLKAATMMLSGSTKRALWIYGAYGTGKSQCAYALRKILEVPTQELEQYWNSYENLKKNNPELLVNIKSYKSRGILTAWRYASGSILTPQQLFLAIQESISKALDEKHFAYKGSNTLRQSVLAWLNDPTHSAFIDDNLRLKAEYRELFSQSNSQEIISALKDNNRDVSGLMGNIFTLAANEGITALNFTADSLREWILDVIKGNNNLKIVFIWDEFSDYFRNNRNSLGEFQKIVSICQEAPFYFVIITHPASSLTLNDDSWKIVQQRFEKIEINLPDNIAFELISHAFSLKDAVKEDCSELSENWLKLKNDFQVSLPDTFNAVMKAAKIKDPNVIKNILPLHPMAAFVLKHIASAFQSNQRSIFDFIKTPGGEKSELRAFQWFIANTGPFDQRPLLTIDMLWEFFYEKGKDYLSHDIRLILDIFSQYKTLSSEEQIVLKTILIMQALYQRLGGAVPLLAPTSQNLRYAFDGDNPKLRNKCNVIAETLVEKKILIQKLGDNKMYSAAVLAGDNERINEHKREIDAKTTTSALVSQCGDELINALNLTPALKLRYIIHPAALSNFKIIIDKIKVSSSPRWKFTAILALAKDDLEAREFRKKIIQAVNIKDCRDIVIIDALSSYLGFEDLDRYINYSAMAVYYNLNHNNEEARINAEKARQVLERDWARKIHNGPIIIYSDSNPDGERISRNETLRVILETYVLRRFPYILDFAPKITESQLKSSQLKQAAKLGMGAQKNYGVMAGIDKNILGKVWDNPNYLNDPELADEHIVIIGKAVNQIINESFNKNGSVSIGKIYDMLENKFGFSISNLSAFIAGFFLRAYKSEPFRLLTEKNHSEILTPDKLSDMIANYMLRRIDSCILKHAKEEQDFYALTSDVWGIPYQDIISSPPLKLSEMLKEKMRMLKFPLWCLEYVDEGGVFDLVNKYIAIVRTPEISSELFIETGRKAALNPSVNGSLKNLLTLEKCRKGMIIFLQNIDDGQLLHIDASNDTSESELISHIENMLNLEQSLYWSKETAINEIRKLIIDYEFVKTANDLMSLNVHSRGEALRVLREYTDFSGCSHDDALKKFPELKTFLNFLKYNSTHSEIRHEILNDFIRNVKTHKEAARNFLGDSQALFNEIYSSYLEGFNDEERKAVKNSVNEKLFLMSSIQARFKIKEVAGGFRKAHKHSKLLALWRTLTDSTNPREWSEKFSMPILCCIDAEIYTQARKIFDLLNLNYLSEKEIDEAADLITALKNKGLFIAIKNAGFRERHFMTRIIGEYSEVFDNIEEVQAELIKTGISPYDWDNNPEIHNKISDMAREKYESYGSSKVLHKIDAMNEQELRNIIKYLVSHDAVLGMKILIGRR